MSEVVFVGTSDAFGAGGRRQSAILVRVESGSVLLDCGATTATGLTELGVERDELDAIVLSHFHADHFGGVPQILLACVYEDRRTRPLEIAGPPEVEHRVRTLAAALGHTLETLPLGFDLRFRELVPGQELEVGPVRVGSFETHHQPESRPHGLSVRGGGQRIVYSGDTGWFEALPAHVRGADLFICECTFARRNFEFHLNYDQLTLHKHDFDCGRHILTHLGSEMVEHRGRCDFETADDGLIVQL